MLLISFYLPALLSFGREKKSSNMCTYYLRAFGYGVHRVTIPTLHTVPAAFSIQCAKSVIISTRRLLRKGLCPTARARDAYLIFLYSLLLTCIVLSITLLHITYLCIKCRARYDANACNSLSVSLGDEPGHIFLVDHKKPDRMNKFSVIAYTKYEKYCMKGQGKN